MYSPKDLDEYVRHSTLPEKKQYARHVTLLSTFINHAEKDNVEEMRECLKKDPTLATQRDLDTQGGTCLHIAAWFGSLSAIQLLLDNNADVNAKDYHRCQPLHLVARKGESLEAAQLLLDAGASRIHVEFTSGTALHAAVDSEIGNPNLNLDMIRLLVNNGFDINAKNEADWSALSSVCHSIHVTKNLSEKMCEIFTNRIHLLVELGADVNGNAGTAQSAFGQLAGYLTQEVEKHISATSLERILKCIRLLVKHGADVNETHPQCNSTHLVLAVMRQSYKTTKFLLELGADANIPIGVSEYLPPTLHGKRISHFFATKVTGLEKIKKLFDKMGVKQYKQRFSLGDRVECNFGSAGNKQNSIFCFPEQPEQQGKGKQKKKGKKKGKKKKKNSSDVYAPGIVVKLDYKEQDYNSSVPYQVRLDSGEYIIVPMDTDLYIRKSNTVGPADYDMHSDPNLKETSTKSCRKKAPRQIRMGLDILNESTAGNNTNTKKKKKKNKKNKNKKNKTTEEEERTIEPDIFVSDRAPNRVLDVTPLLNTINLQQSESNEMANTAIATNVTNHKPPPDPVFAIEIPNLSAVGPPMDFLQYSGVRDFEIMSMEIPTGCALGRTLSTSTSTSSLQRPEMFNNVATSWVKTSMLRYNDKMQWLCGSTRYGCDICAEVTQKVIYRDSEAHGVSHQYNQIRLNRPTLCILYGDPHAPKDSPESKASYVMWGVHKGVLIKACDFQPDGTRYVDKQGLPTFQQSLLLVSFSRPNAKLDIHKRFCFSYLTLTLSLLFLFFLSLVLYLIHASLFRAACISLCCRLSRDWYARRSTSRGEHSCFNNRQNR